MSTDPDAKDDDIYWFLFTHVNKGIVNGAKSGGLRFILEQGDNVGKSRFRSKKILLDSKDLPAIVDTDFTTKNIGEVTVTQMTQEESVIYDNKYKIGTDTSNRTWAAAGALTAKNADTGVTKTGLSAGGGKLNYFYGKLKITNKYNPEYGATQRLKEKADWR